MTMLEWYREIQKKERAELTQEVTREVTREVTQKVEQKFMQERARLFERRIGRVLDNNEFAVLTKRVAELGAERVMDIALDSSPTELEAWLKA
jgi:hypothetical protein